MTPRWPRWIFGATIILIVLCLATIRRLHPDTSLEALFANNDPAAKAMVRVLNGYRAAEEFVILASSPQPDPEKLQHFAAELQKAIADDSEGSRLALGVIWKTDPQTEAFFEKVVVPEALFYLDNQAFAAACQRLSREEIFKQIQQDRAMLAAPGPAAQQLSKLILFDPLRLHEFIVDRLISLRPFKTYHNSNAFLSADGRSILIRIPGRRPVSDLQFSRDFTAAMERLAKQTNHDHLELNFTGSYAIAATSQAAIRSDVISSVLGSVVFLQLLFLLAYRRPIWSFLLAITPIAIGILIGFAAYALLKSTFTPVAAAIGGILAGMGIDYSIQFLSHYERGRETSPGAAAMATLRILWPAMLAAWATSVIGFAAIGSANVRALRDFSLLGSLGLSGAFVAALTVLPAMLAFFSTGERKIATLRPSIFNPAILEAIARRRQSLFVIGALLFLAAGVVLSLPGKWISLDPDLAALNPQPNPPLDAERIIQRRMGASPEGMICYLHADSPAALISLAHQAGKRLRQIPGVSGTFGLDSLLPDPKVAAERLRELNPDLASKVVADFRGALAANGFQFGAFSQYADFLRLLITNQHPPDLNTLMQYPSLAETILPADSLPLAAQMPSGRTSMGTYSQLATRNSPASCAPTLTLPRSTSGGDGAHDAVTYIFTARQSDTSIESIRAALADVPGATLTGLGVLSHDAEANVARQFPRLLGVAIFAIAAYLLIHFRNLRDMVLSLLPTIVSLACVLTFARLSHTHLNIINLVAFPLLLGIDVDYGVFLVSAARRNQRRTLTPDELLAKIFPSFSAVILCAAATMLGFVSLLFTSIPAIHSLGLLVSVGILGCAVAIVLICVPAMLMKQ